MKQEELNGALRRHEAWMKGKFGGERADLHGVDLTGADLQGKDLQNVILHHANLHCADLQHTDLQHTDLRHADLQHTELQRAKLQHTELQHSDLRHADLRDTELHGANLYNSDMRGTDIDHASWPLWCGSLQAYVDDRIAIQLLYHTLSVVQHSPYVSEDVKQALLSAENVRIANRFHRVGECGEIKEWEEGTK